MEGGLSQNLNETEIYIEQNSLYLEIPFTVKRGFKITPQEFHLGLKREKTLMGIEFYYKPLLIFENYSPSGIELKLGKKIKVLGMKLGLELGVRNPRWYKRSAFKLKPDLSLKLFDFTLNNLNEQGKKKS
uniref:Uncharacterized protein n=1 Tax=uncultured organism TaxID=155900 RepID=M1PPQ5_9ZZZZ|nr:hypothetical protein FLSS-17_0003 [uncultured organism]